MTLKQVNQPLDQNQPQGCSDAFFIDIGQCYLKWHMLAMKISQREDKLKDKNPDDFLQNLLKRNYFHGSSDYCVCPTILQTQYVGLPLFASSSLHAVGASVSSMQPCLF